MNPPEDTAMMRKNLDKLNIVFSYPEYTNPNKAGPFESIFFWWWWWWCACVCVGGGAGGGQYDQPHFYLRRTNPVSVQLYAIVKQFI